MLLDLTRAQLVVIDVQERLLSALAQPDILVEACRRLISAANLLSAPVRLSEQYVKGLGYTPEVLRGAVAHDSIFEKMSFSCLGQPLLAKALLARERPQVVLCGAEAHVCVLQTAMDLLSAGREVFIVADAVASREPPIKALALQRLAARGAQIISVEMAVFEWLRVAGSADFKSVSPLVQDLLSGPSRIGT